MQMQFVEHPIKPLFFKFIEVEIKNIGGPMLYVASSPAWRAQRLGQSIGTIAQASRRTVGQLAVAQDAIKLKGAARIVGSVDRPRLRCCSVVTRDRSTLTKVPAGAVMAAPRWGPPFLRSLTQRIMISPGSGWHASCWSRESASGDGPVLRVLCPAT
jgi:hypothetical protein